jgi:hypothetical protein
VALDSDSSLSLQIHIVKRLILHLTLAYCSSRLEQTVRQGAFAVINVGNDAKISNLFHREFVWCKITLQETRFTGCSFAFLYGASMTYIYKLREPGFVEKQRFLTNEGSENEKLST